MERRRQRPGVQGTGPVMREEDLLTPPDYSRRFGPDLRAAPNYYGRGDMGPQTLEMRDEKENNDLGAAVRRRRELPQRLTKGGPVKKSEKWIQGAIKKPGALRAQMGVKEGQTIPKAKLAKAAKAPGKLGQRARFAQTLAKMGKK